MFLFYCQKSMRKEMKRKVCASDELINILFARESDRKLIYDLSIKDNEIILAMFDDPTDFRWEDIRDEKSEFFDENASLNKYLLIEFNNEIIGIFYHTYHPALIANVEFHIWFVSKKYTGRGLGTKIVSMMKDYIHTTYQINTFIMRPWIKNPQAIRTYEKCGFEIIENFDVEAYFTSEEIAIYGNGAYSVEQTVNMVAIV